MTSINFILFAGEKKCNPINFSGLEVELAISVTLRYEVFVAKTSPIITDGKKPKGVKRLNDLINFEVDIPKLIRHLD